jgi:hypothetical protein
MFLGSPAIFNVLSNVRAIIIIPAFSILIKNIVEEYCDNYAIRIIPPISYKAEILCSLGYLFLGLK